LHDAIVAALAQRGYAVAPDALPASTIDGLRDRACELDSAGALTAAHVGHAQGRVARADIRGDRIAWLGAPQTAAERHFVQWLEVLRIACNRELFLGLAQFEGHYALYPAGAAYARHRDRFRDDDARVLSCVLYLNDRWTKSDGGALRLHVDSMSPVDVLPEGGTFVAFLAADFDHEVLVASRERLSLSGWFRRRARGTAVLECPS
jgi:SM-20-related protein